jgi:hypothetical protein
MANMLFYVTSQLGMQHENGCQILISLLSHTLQMIKYDFKSIRFWGVFILELVIVYWYLHMVRIQSHITNILLEFL